MALPGALDVTVVEELTQSQSQSKQLYDSCGAQELSEGFTLRPDWVAQLEKLDTTGFGQAKTGLYSLASFIITIQTSNRGSFTQKPEKLRNKS
jgi:hypothetical protein